MIAFDTETTGLAMADGTPLQKQPHIIEFAAIKLDDVTLEEKGRIEFLCKPPIVVTPEMSSHNGIFQKDIEDKQPFAAHIKDLIDFFIGERHMVAHNVAFDRQMMTFELQRLGMLTKFPWPPNHICTVEKTYYIKNRRMKLTELSEMIDGKVHDKAHRAMNDVEAMVRVIRWLREQKEKTAA